MRTCYYGKWLFTVVAIAADYDKKSKQIRDQVMTAANSAQSGYHPRKLFELLLNTAQLEYILQQVMECTMTIQSNYSSQPDV